MARQGSDSASSTGKVEDYRKEHAEDAQSEYLEISDEAREAQLFESALNLRESVKLYRCGVFWSMLFSTAVIMEGYDNALMGSFFGYPQFNRRYGTLQTDGTYVISADWQTGLQCATQAGMFIGVLASGWLVDRFGYKKTNLGVLTWMMCAIFIPFFAPSLGILVLGQVMQGIPWGAFQGITCSYAADVAPQALRPVLTTYVNMCWVIGQFIATGVLRGLLNRTDEWSYRIPFAVQWLWPIPLFVLGLWAPESPYYLVRKGEEDQAVEVMKRITSPLPGSGFTAEGAVALMSHTNKIERSISEGTTYFDCFKGIDLRRTEIACAVYVSQQLCGSGLMGYSNYFLQQAGFTAENSFNLSLGQYALGLVGTASSWWLMKAFGRRHIFIGGLVMLCALMAITGFLGFIPKTNTSAIRSVGAMLLVYTFIYDLTVGPITYALVSEMGSTRLRSKTVVLARDAYNLVGFANTFLMPRFINPTAWNWGAKTGLFWAGTCSVCIVYCYFRLPEPRGRTYAELDILFERKISARKFASTAADPFSHATGQSTGVSIVQETNIAVKKKNSVSHALSVRLIPAQDDGSSNSEDGTIVSHLITARNNFLQVWEVREFVDPVDGNTTAKLFHCLSKRLHGTITSLARVRTLASKIDGSDRVLISFLDAKLSLLEWTASAHDLTPVSLHTFEKLPQVAEGMTKTATDPASRLTVMLLPSNTGGDGTLAILPFFQEEIDLDSIGVDAEAWGPDGVASIPYAPSHLLPLASLTASSITGGPARSSTLSNPITLVGGTPPIRNVIDMTFLPGFNEPTLAILYAPEQTWAGRLENVHNNVLVSLVTLAHGSSKGQDSDTTAVVIATSPSLPHTCLSIHPCPPDLGGALILTANGIMHLEQGGKLVSVAANGWFSKDYPASFKSGEETIRTELEGAQIVFVSNRQAIVFSKNGSILELKFVVSGRSISGMKLELTGRGVAASCVERIRGSRGRFGETGYVFVGSHVGESSLLKWEAGDAADGGTVKEPSRAMDVDFEDEEDIYGSSETKEETKAVVSKPRKLAGGRSLLLTKCDLLEHYGAIRSMTVGLVGDESSADLVASTGQGPTAGLTVFHRNISPRKRRRLDISAPFASAGIWALSVGQKRIIVTADANTTTIDDGQDRTERSGTTIAAFSSPDRQSIIRVTPNEVHVLDPDLSVRQSHSLSSASPATRAALSGPLLIIYGPSKEIEIFTSNLKTGQLDPFDAASEQTKTASAISTWSDSSRVIPLVRPAPSTSRSTLKARADADDDEDDLYATAPRRKLASETTGSLSLVIEPTAEAGAVFTQNGSRSWQWLPLVDENGDLQIYLLPKMELVFSARSIALFPEVLEDGIGQHVPENIDEDDIKIDRIVLADIGQSRTRPHLIVLLTNGSLAVYEALPSISATSNSNRKATLGVRFVKVLTKRLPLPVRRRGKRGADEEEPVPPPRRDFVPYKNLGGYSGVFMTGDEPFWLIASDHGSVKYLEHGEKGVYGFTQVIGEEDYVVQTKEGLYQATLPNDVCFDRELPYQRIPKDRRYAAVTFDLDSGLYVAGALYETIFMNFDDEGNPVYTKDDAEQTDARNFRSTVELIMPGTWEAIDGYEFRANEFVSTLRSVSLATKSTASGRKEFIAVGTTVFRAEDLAARGGIYLFEVVPIIPDPSTPHIAHKLKRLFFEDTKSVVGNLCDIDGHLIMSMGQKLYARAFEQDEVFIAVGFLDVGVHVTSLTAMKNFLLIGDALQSVSLVAFQEEPYKLVMLGRDYRSARVSSTNFLVNDGKVAFVVGDLDGVLRSYEYDPMNIASYAGQRLLCRTEYSTSIESQASLLFSRRSSPLEDIKQNGILYGSNDGSLSSLVPVRDIVFKRLTGLQALMFKHVQSWAGLNPRGYRLVKNDSVSRAISKGILDGELLNKFENLSLDKQVDLCEMIGTDPDTVLANLRALISW